MNITFFGKTIGFDNGKQKSRLPVIYGSRYSQNPLLDKSGVKLACHNFYTIYKNNTDMASCIRELQKWTAKGGHRYLNPQDPDKEVGQNMQKELNKLFNSPHSTTKTFKELKNSLIYHRKVSGNAYAYIIRNVLKTGVLGLQVLDSRTISIVSDKHGKIHRYVQQTGTETVIFEPEEILHWKEGDNSDNPLFGLSPIEPPIWEVKTDLAAMISNYKFFENNAIPAALYIMDETLSNDELTKAVDFMKKEHSGAQNAHKSSALVGVKDIKQMQLPNKDVEFLAGRELSRKKIHGAYGVPDFLTGYTDKVNNNNGSELFRKFIEGTIQDEEDDFESFINDQFFAILGINEIVYFDIKSQQVETQFDIIKSALDEYQKGALTLRQYKNKTRQRMTKEDEKNPMIDQYIIHQGASAIILEDVGTQDLEVAKNAEALKIMMNNA